MLHIRHDLAFSKKKKSISLWVGHPLYDFPPLASAAACLAATTTADAAESEAW